MDRRRVLRMVGFVAVLVVIAPFVVSAVPQVIGADGSYTVLSSSMSPAIRAGDQVVVDDVPVTAIEEGDVITFRPPVDHELSNVDRVTHRVVAVEEGADGRRFRTKGDANEEADGALVPAENVVGRVAYRLPWIGQIVLFAQSRFGILLLVVVPGVLLLLSEVYDFVAAASKEEGHATDER